VKSIRNRRSKRRISIREEREERAEKECSAGYPSEGETDGDENDD